MIAMGRGVKSEMGVLIVSAPEGEAAQGAEEAGMAIRKGEAGEASGALAGARVGRRGALVVGVCVGLLVWSAAARAQPAITMSRSQELASDSLGKITRGDDLMPDYARLIAWDLRLDPHQRSAAIDLYDGFKSQWIEADEKMHAYWTAAREQLAGGPDPALERDLDDAWRRHSEFRQRIRAQLDEDIRAILSEEQLGRWVMRERSAARYRMLRNVAGEPLARVDLARLAERATRKTGSSAELLDLADRYALDMGALVDEYNRWFAQWMAGQRARIADAGGDASADQRLTQREQRRFMTRVADLNEAYAIRFADLLTVEQRGGFLREYVVLAAFDGYERRDTSMQIDEILQRVQTLPGLEPQVLAQIQQAVAEYQDESLRRQLTHVAKVREHERTLMDSLDPNEAGRERNTFRFKLWEAESADTTQKLMQQLRDLLTPEQLADMPPPLGVRTLVPPIFED
jgi:hypothetical protein